MKDVKWMCRRMSRVRCHKDGDDVMLLCHPQGPLCHYWPCYCWRLVPPDASRWGSYGPSGQETLNREMSIEGDWEIVIYYYYFKCAVSLPMWYQGRRSGYRSGRTRSKMGGQFSTTSTLSVNLNELHDPMTPLLTSQSPYAVCHGTIGICTFSVSPLLLSPVYPWPAKIKEWGNLF